MLNWPDVWGFKAQQIDFCVWMCYLETVFTPPCLSEMWHSRRDTSVLAAGEAANGVMSIRTQNSSLTGLSDFQIFLDFSLPISISLSFFPILYRI